MEEKSEKSFFAGKAGKIIIAAIVIAFAALLALGVALAMKNSLGGGMPGEVVQAVVASDKETAYSVDSDSVISMRPYGNGIVLLTDISVAYLDENGNISAEDTHTLVSPSMYVQGSRVIAYSRMSDKVRIEKNCKPVQELNANSSVLCCAVGKKGNYAVCTYNDNGYASRLKVFNSENKAVFEWGCASDYIVAAALSDNGKYAAVAVAGAQNAESYTKILFFDFNYTSEKYSVVLADSTAYAVSFINNKTILACADNGVHKIDFDGKEEVLISCLSGQMKRSDICISGLSAFCVSGAADNAGDMLEIFDKKGVKTGSAALDGSVLSVSCSEKYTAVAFNDRVELYNAGGALCKTVKTDLSCVSAVTEGRSIFILCVSGIAICSTE